MACFIEKAKEAYCVEQVGASGSSQQFFQDTDSGYTLIPSPPYVFEHEEERSPYWKENLDFVTTTHDWKTTDGENAEKIKFYLRVRDFNILASQADGINGCHGKIDVLSLEEEYWNAGTALNVSTDFWNVHVPLLGYMRTIKNINNADPAQNPLMVEDYIAKFHNDTIDDYQQVDTLDGFIDRYLLTFYIGTDNIHYDYVTNFFTTNQLWQEKRLVQLGSNHKQSEIWPIFEAGYIIPNRPFLGLWLQDTAHAGNSTGAAEHIFRNLYEDSLLYGTNGGDHYGEASNHDENKMTGYMWFAYSARPFPYPGPFEQCLGKGEDEERRRNSFSYDNDFSVRVHGEFLEINLSENAMVANYLIRYYSTEGKLLSEQQSELAAGENSLALPNFPSQLCFVQVVNITNQVEKTLLAPLVKESTLYFKRPEK